MFVWNNVSADAGADRLTGAGNHTPPSAGDQVASDNLDMIDTAFAFNFGALLS